MIIKLINFILTITQACHQRIVVVNPNQFRGLQNPNYAAYPHNSPPVSQQSNFQSSYVPKPVYPPTTDACAPPPSYESTSSGQNAYQNYSNVTNYIKS